MPIHIIQFQIQTHNLILNLRNRGLKMRPNDTDIGYLIHSWIMATFEQNPFHCFHFDVHPRHANILAYSDYSAEDILKNKKQQEQSVENAINWDTFQSKMLPEIWPKHTTLQFETSVCPTTRVTDTITKKQQEIDMYLYHKNSGQNKYMLREDIYIDWFQHKIHTDIAQVSNLEVTKFQVQSMVRKTHTQHPQQSKSRNISLPICTIQGTITIQDSDKFTTLLTKGIGRHKAFGMGMLLLKRL